jgi:hypothetical protein
MNNDYNTDILILNCHPQKYDDFKKDIFENLNKYTNLKIINITITNTPIYSNANEEYFGYITIVDCNEYLKNMLMWLNSKYLHTITLHLCTEYISYDMKIFKYCYEKLVTIENIIICGNKYGKMPPLHNLDMLPKMFKGINIRVYEKDYTLYKNIIDKSSILNLNSKYYKSFLSAILSRFQRRNNNEHLYKYNLAKCWICKQLHNDRDRSYCYSCKTENNNLSFKCFICDNNLNLVDAQTVKCNGCTVRYTYNKDTNIITVHIKSKKVKINICPSETCKCHYSNQLKYCPQCNKSTDIIKCLLCDTVDIVCMSSDITKIAETAFGKVWICNVCQIRHTVYEDNTCDVYPYGSSFCLY